MKRFLDVFLAILTLIVFSPLILIIPIPLLVIGVAIAAIVFDFI